MYGGVLLLTISATSKKCLTKAYTRTAKSCAARSSLYSFWQPVMLGVRAQNWKEIMTKNWTLLITFSLFLSGCGKFDVPPPERMTNSNHVPVASDASYIAIPVRANLDEVLSDTVKSAKNPLASKSEVVNIPTSLHIEHFVTETVRKEIEKLENKTINETKRVCKRSEKRCSRTRQDRKRICAKTKKIPIVGDIVCIATKVVTETVCVAHDTVCVAHETVVVGTKVIQVPVKVIEDVQEEVLKVVDKISDLDAEVDYTVVLVGVDARLDGTKLSVKVDLDYKIKVNSRLNALDGKIKVVEVNGITSCGYDEPMRRIRFFMDGTLNTSDGPKFEVVDTSWRIEWVNACQLTAFDIQLEDILDLPIIEKAVKKAVDKGVDRLDKSVDFSDKVHTALKSISKPLLIDTNIGRKEANHELLLHLLPALENVEIAPVSGNGKSLHTTIFVEANPAVVVSDTAPNVTQTNPPNLKVRTRDPGIRLKVATRIDFAKARDLILTEMRRDQKLPVEIEDIELYGSKGKLVVAVSITHPAKGVLYLVGTPTYDDINKIISVKDLDYTAETRNVIIDVLDAVAHKHVVKALRKAAKFPIDKHANKALDELREKTIDVSDEVDLVLRAENLALTDVWVSPDGIFADLILEGTAEGRFRKP